MIPNATFGFDDQAFQAELASFIGFVGADTITNFLRRLDQRLGAISPLARTLYGERFFLHQQLVSFSDQRNAFQLDTSDVFAVRAASFIAAANRMAELLTTDGKNRLHGLLVDALDPDSDARKFEHDLRCFTHLSRKGYSIDFPDMNEVGIGRIYDLLVTAPFGQFEVECKTITDQAGLQIKSQLSIGLFEAFRKYVGLGRSIETSGIFTLQLHQPAAQCKNLANRLRDALMDDGPLPDENDFTLTFEARPEWQEAFDNSGFAVIRERIAAEVSDDAHCAIKLDDCIAAIVFRAHKPSTLTKNVIDVLEDACKQCSGTRPSVIWLHFIGMNQADFREIVDFSRSGSGAGLNAAVSITLHDRQNQPVRTHVERVRFSADPSQLTSHPALAPNLLLTSSVSLDGMLYDVPNPRCLFPAIKDV